MATEHRCSTCGKALEANAPGGLCPECLIKVGLGSGVDLGTDTKTGATRRDFVPPSVEKLGPLFPQLEILELIGKGGMGAVYKARQRELDRIVALKILPPDIGQDAAFAERFTREARALAKLNHPGIVTLYEFGRANGLYFFLMEYVDGVNLRRLLAGGRVSAREALAIVPQICDALQYAHDQGIVHRDIKPENILLDRRGRVKVADFGLAKIIGNQNEGEPSGRESVPASPALSDASKVMGTPQYMSPEQISAPGEVDHRADIYALGVVFYQMLTGELPLGRFQPPSRMVQVDVRLDEVVLHALEKNPDRRYQHASQMKTAVESIVNTPVDQAPPMQKPDRFWRRFAIVMGCVVLIPILLLVLVMVLVILLSGCPRSGATAVRSVHDRPASISTWPDGGNAKEARTKELQLRLAQAENELQRMQSAHANGGISAGDFNAAQVKVALLKAELEGDSVKFVKTRLEQAERELLRLKEPYAQGAVPMEAFDAAQVKVALLKAELEGDPVKMAKIKLDAAQRRMVLVERLFQAGAVGPSDHENAKTELAIAKVKLDEATKDRTGGSVAMPIKNPGMEAGTNGVKKSP